MKQDEIQQAVKESFKVINKLSKKIIDGFNIDSIHDFRVEIKNLRAFLRLLSVENNDKSAMLTKKMKAFYGYAGIIRNIQLQLQMAENYCNEKQLPQPLSYLSLLQMEAHNWKKELMDLMEGNNFYDDEEYIMKKLPNKLTKTSIKQFAVDKVTDIKIQMTHLHNEESMHNMRKLLKDLMYTWPYINELAILPAFINNKQSLKSLTTIIGDFNDLCMQLMFLGSAYFDKIKDENEKKILNKITKDCLTNKAKIKKEMTVKLKLLDFNASTPA